MEKPKKSNGSVRSTRESSKALWKVRFARSRASEAELKRNGKNPEKVPVPDTLVRLMLGNIDGQWKIFAIFVN